jgi:uncharacterized protein (DUF1697 family)
MARYVALLRAISNVSMAPFRAGMEALGYAEVASFGMSGNLIFTAEGGADGAVMEERIGRRLGAVAIVRSAGDMARAAKLDRFPEARWSTAIFLARAPTPAERERFLALDFAAPKPVLQGREAFYAFPLTLAGKKGNVDIEKAIGVTGTQRTMRVVRRIAELMNA